nr:helix-turn-helix domain-containing protein [uncultured Sellimonas sp.]
MNIDWMDMVYYQQQVQKLSRLLLPAKHTNLTVSECELLAWLYLEPDQNTPVLLSQRSGMKKEAVSRCLKSLIEKDCIRKEKQPHDERSYKISLTDTGVSELKKGYEIILQPFYDLWRTAGDDFEEFLQCTCKIVAHIKKAEQE